MEFISGGVCAAKGFTANGIHCGIRKNPEKRDLALVYSEKRAAAAAVYTTNKVKGATLLVTRRHLADGCAQAIVCNSGNANTGNHNGPQVAEGMAALAARAMGIEPADMVVASTGVIGLPMDLAPIEAGMPALAAGLSRDGGDFAAQAIMTTDTVPKQAAVRFEVGGVPCRLGGMAKGSGMIHPNMATMLVFLTTDCAISPVMLQKALSENVKRTFNMLSVDGDTSTNDTVCVLANAMAQNPPVKTEGPDFDAFSRALDAVMVQLCRAIAADGEGASKLLECRVTGAKDEHAARLAAKSVICSSLVKSAMFGADANWGRVLCAVGYSGIQADLDHIDIVFSSRAGDILLCRDGTGVDFSEEEAKKILSEDEIDILITLRDGDGAATAWGCDLTYDYVHINGDYRT